MKILLHLYPKPWREEYGPELEHMLQSRPLTTRVIADVFANALRQRVHSAGVPEIAGAASALVVLTGLVWNIASPPAENFALTSILRDSWVTFPRLVVSPINSLLFHLLLVYLGYRTYVPGNTVRQSGKAAAKVAAIAGIPVMMAAVLMAVGALGVNSADHRLNYTYFITLPYLHFHPGASNPGWLSVFFAPLFAIPQCWLWGVMGGALGKRVKHWRASS